ncbi:MAG: type II secretion system protein [Nitrospina sp.]|jgi:prepilin-type N-terminal cleavage/methylation domain-containing protein|nr:type II secretion system protein [Nitrospina sp.]MBT6718325.1 type II secretion system protein [Nitrospina sp.]
MNLKFNIIQKNQSGFTLLELIVSLAIVGIIIALGLGGVRLGITARDVGEKQVDTYQRLRIITEQLTQKLQSAYPVFVAQKDGVSIAKVSSAQRVMAFEGESNSLRFVTFASPITATGQGTWTHEVKFYLGKHPETEKPGLILMEKEISEGDIFSRILPNAENTKYFLLAENVSQLKFRYYEVKKLQSDGEPGEPTHTGQWVNRVVMDPFQIDQNTPTNPILAFEKANKISLPRAVEITIGVTPSQGNNKEDSQEEPETVFSPPIVVLLNSGMEIAVPDKKEEDNEKA